MMDDKPLVDYPGSWVTFLGNVPGYFGSDRRVFGVDCVGGEGGFMSKYRIVENRNSRYKYLRYQAQVFNGLWWRNIPWLASEEDYDLCVSRINAHREPRPRKKVPALVIKWEDDEPTPPPPWWAFWKRS